MKHSANVMSRLVLGVVLVFAVTAGGPAAASLFEPLEDTVPNELIVGLTEEAMADFRLGQYHELDELNSLYGLVEIRALRTSRPLLLLTFDQDYNTQMLADIYIEAEPVGMLRAKPNHTFWIPEPWWPIGFPRMFTMDIRPKNINLNARGLVAVVIFGAEGFDVEDIDLLSLDPLPVTKGKSGKVGSFTDFNHDSITDLLLHFDKEDMDIPHDPGTAILITDSILHGRLNDGTLIFGNDSIRIVPPGDTDYGGQIVLPEPPFQLPFVGYAGQVAAIPEPATLALMLLAGLAMVIRKRK